MKAHNVQNIALTHQDIEQAIARFRGRGGLIRQLPDQVVRPGAPVHSRNETQFVVAQTPDAPRRTSEAA